MKVILAALAGLLMFAATLSAALVAMDLSPLWGTIVTVPIGCWLGTRLARWERERG